MPCQSTLRCTTQQWQFHLNTWGHIWKGKAVPVMMAQATKSARGAGAMLWKQNKSETCRWTAGLSRAYLFSSLVSQWSAPRGMLGLKLTWALSSMFEKTARDAGALTSCFQQAWLTPVPLLFHKVPEAFPALPCRPASGWSQAPDSALSRVLYGSGHCVKLPGVLLELRLNINTRSGSCFFLVSWLATASFSHLKHTEELGCCCSSCLPLVCILPPPLFC